MCPISQDSTHHPFVWTVTCLSQSLLDSQCTNELSMGSSHMPLSENQQPGNPRSLDPATGGKKLFLSGPQSFRSILQFVQNARVFLLVDVYIYAYF